MTLCKEEPNKSDGQVEEYFTTVRLHDQFHE